MNGVGHMTTHHCPQCRAKYMAPLSRLSALCPICVSTNRVDAQIAKMFDPKATMELFTIADGPITNNASTGTWVGDIEHLKKSFEDLQSGLPPPMDLHVTPEFHKMLKDHISRPGGVVSISGLRLNGCEVFESLPERWPVPYVWLPRKWRTEAPEVFR